MRIIVDRTRPLGPISRHIHGHFAEHLGRCIYEGIWVGEDSPIPNEDGYRSDVLGALKALELPNLRWPGGCFADTYHWRDGIGPRQTRPRFVNVHWGGVTENNHFGSHEFMALCEKLRCAPYICGNLGSGTVREMSQWVEYLTFGGDSPLAGLRRENGRAEPWAVPFWGVGNENWGCGGDMRAEYYADEYRRYACYIRDWGMGRPTLVAGGANKDDYEWTRVLMERAAPYMDGLSVHCYTAPGSDWQHKGPALGFDEQRRYEVLEKALFMDELLTRHSAIMDQYDPARRVGLMVDEWGTWYDPEEGTLPGFHFQQNSMADALVAGLTLHIFHRHGDRVRMANLAQVVNVLQSVVLTDGPRMLRTPTYHVFEMYRVHQDARRVDLFMDEGRYEMNGRCIPRLSASVSEKDGKLSLTVCNLSHDEGAALDIELRGMSPGGPVCARVLASDALDGHNTFDEPDRVIPRPLETAWKEDRLLADLPPSSVAVLTFG